MLEMPAESSPFFLQFDPLFLSFKLKIGMDKTIQTDSNVGV